jgi:hypothetical protein
MKKILISLAGGSIPGGLFAAGAVEELAKEFVVKKASGASSGAINGAALMSGHGNELGDLWLDALNDLHGLVTLNPIKVVKNNSFFLIQEFAYNFFETMVRKNYLNDCHDLLIAYTKLSQRFFPSEKITIADRLLFPWLILPAVRKKIGMTTETVDIEKISKDRRLSVLKASCCLPFFHGLPVKIDKHICFDGQLNQDLGGAPELLRFYNPGDYVALIFRYEVGNPKNLSRTQQFYSLCQSYSIPRKNIMIIAPNEKLPISGHYDIDRDNYKICVEMGRRMARYNIAKY